MGSHTRPRQVSGHGFYPCRTNLSPPVILSAPRERIATRGPQHARFFACWGGTEGKSKVEPFCGRLSPQAKSRAKPRELRNIPTIHPLPYRLREFYRCATVQTRRAPRKLPPRKIAALQTVILNERRSREWKPGMKDLDRSRIPARFNSASPLHKKKNTRRGAGC